MIAALVTRALAHPYDEDERWAPIRDLHQHADPAAVQTVVRPLLDDPDPIRRTLAADVLGQVGGPDAADRPERAALLIARLAVEDDPLVLSSIAFALSHLDDPRALGPLVPLAGHEHPLVRRAVVNGLSVDSDDDRVVGALIALSADPVAETRDWATFALGHIGHRTGPRVAAALVARLDDEDDDTREEAIYGLALRESPRAIPALIRELEIYEGGLLDRSLVLLADAFPGDARLLEAMAERWPGGVPDDVRQRVASDVDLHREERRP